jgi:predicted nucleic acid-binding protein
MAGRSFLDTNILVYTDDHDTPKKRDRALEFVARARLEGWGVVSTQVLQEYFVAATMKLRVPVAIARRKVELFGRLNLVQIDLPDVLGAIDLRRLHTVGFWDALILRAAQRAGCVTLFTEDLQHGARFDGVEVVNPFRTP